MDGDLVGVGGECRMRARDKVRGEGEGVMEIAVKRDQ